MGNSITYGRREFAIVDTGERSEFVGVPGKGVLYIFYTQCGRFFQQRL